jgi:hypothetical protein
LNIVNIKLHENIFLSKQIIDLAGGFPVIAEYFSHQYNDISQSEGDKKSIIFCSTTYSQGEKTGR